MTPPFKIGRISSHYFFPLPLSNLRFTHIESIQSKDPTIWTKASFWGQITSSTGPIRTGLKLLHWSSAIITEKRIVGDFHCSAV